MLVSFLSSSVALRLWCLSSTKKHVKDPLFRKTLSFFFLLFIFLFLPRGRILDPIGKYKMAFLIDQPWLAIKSWHFGGDTEIELFPRCLVDGLNFFSSMAKARADDVRHIFFWLWFRDIHTIWVRRRLELNIPWLPGAPFVHHHSVHQKNDIFQDGVIETIALIPIITRKETRGNAELHSLN